MSLTKWKIQVALHCGWADLKRSLDHGESFVDEHYDTIEEAMFEMINLIDANETDGTEIRVVHASVPEEEDMYK